jgi:hypothetical protein
MKKSHFKTHSGTFEELEAKTLEDYRTRRPLTVEENEILSALRSTVPEGDEEGVITDISEQAKELLLDGAEIVVTDTNEFVEKRAELFKEADRMAGYLRKGKKYPLLARNPQRVKAGRRFVYIGVDGDLHIGRKGRVIFPAMAVE